MRHKNVLMSSSGFSIYYSLTAKDITYIWAYYSSLDSHVRVGITDNAHARNELPSLIVIEVIQLVDQK